MESFNGSSDSQLSLSRIEKKKKRLDLIDKLTALGHDSVENNTRVEQISKVLKEANDLARVGEATASDARLDSYLFCKLGELTLSSTRLIEANTNVYDPSELAEHVRDNPAYWQFQLPQQVPAASFLHGAFDPAPPEQRPRAPRRRAERQRAATVKKPEAIARLEKAEEDTAMIDMVRKCIVSACRAGPLGYFRCVLDPASFGRTVQNIFYVAFLVRDGKVAVYLDEQNGLPMVRPSSAAPLEERDMSKENQFIVSLDMARWRKLIEAFDIRQALIPVK